MHDDIIFTTTLRILQFVVFLGKLGLLLFKPLRDGQIQIKKGQKKKILVVEVKCRHPENGPTSNIEVLKQRALSIDYFPFCAYQL